MADEQELPDNRPEGIPPSPPAKKPPAKAAKKAPAKKAPVKKAPAKKAPAKKAPVKQAPAAAAPPPPATTPPVQTNGSAPPAAGVKEAAAQAKSAVDRADSDIVRPSLMPLAEPARSPLPLAVAIAVSLLAILLVRSLRRDEE